jgi:hypothetical protein
MHDEFALYKFGIKNSLQNSQAKDSFIPKFCRAFTITIH